MATKKKVAKKKATIPTGFIAQWEDFFTENSGNEDFNIRETLEEALDDAERAVGYVSVHDFAPGASIPRVLVGQVKFTHAVSIPQINVEKL